MRHSNLSIIAITLVLAHKSLTFHPCTCLIIYASSFSLIPCQAIAYTRTFTPTLILRIINIGCEVFKTQLRRTTWCSCDVGTVYCNGCRNTHCIAYNEQIADVRMFAHDTLIMFTRVECLYPSEFSCVAKHKLQISISIYGWWERRPNLESHAHAHHANQTANKQYKIISSPTTNIYCHEIRNVNGIKRVLCFWLSLYCALENSTQSNKWWLTISHLA